MQVEGFTLSRTVNVSVIIVLIVNTVATVWWAATLDYQVENHEKRLVKLESDIADVENNIKMHITRMQDDITRIKTILEYSEVNTDKKK